MQMRNSLFNLAITAFAVLAAGAAQATTANLAFSNLAGAQSPGIVISGDTATMALGDTFEISIVVDNTSGDAVTDLFTFLNYTPGAFALVQGVGLEILDEGIFGQSLTPLSGFGDPAIGQPAGTFVGLAHGVVGAGDSTAATVDIGTIIVLQATGVGSFTVSQSGSGNSTINGQDGPPSFGPNLTVTVVPEPGTALLMGLGLAGLAAAGRRGN